MDGPRTVHHDFSTSFCEVKLTMTISNSSDAIASVHVSTLDLPSSSGQSSDVGTPQSAVPSGNQAGWHDIPVVSDTKVTSAVPGTHVGKLQPVESASPFIWCGSSSTKAQLQPFSTIRIPLQISVFFPGIYDLSNYVLNWNLIPNSDQEDLGQRQSSGTCQGYPYLLTVLQST